MIKASDLKNMNSEAMKGYEETIDNFLIKNVSRVTGSGAHFTLPHGWSYDDATFLAKKYKSFGYDVDVNSCQRDGTWMTFKIRKGV